MSETEEADILGDNNPVVNQLRNVLCNVIIYACRKQWGDRSAG